MKFKDIPKSKLIHKGDHFLLKKSKKHGTLHLAICGNCGNIAGTENSSTCIILDENIKCCVKPDYYWHINAFVKSQWKS